LPIILTMQKRSWKRSAILLMKNSHLRNSFFRGLRMNNKSITGYRARA
jgi:hypothetical protein